MISYEHMHDRSFRNQAFNELQENNCREQDRSMNVMSSRLTSVHVEILMLALVYLVEYRVVFHIFVVIQKWNSIVLNIFLVIQNTKYCTDHMFSIRNVLMERSSSKIHVCPIRLNFYVCVCVCFLRSLPNYKFQIQRNYRQKADFCHQQNKSRH